MIRICMFYIRTLRRMKNVNNQDTFSFLIREVSTMFCIGFLFAFNQLFGSFCFFIFAVFVESIFVVVHSSCRLFIEFFLLFIRLSLAYFVDLKKDLGNPLEIESVRDMHTLDIWIDPYAKI